MKPDSFYSVLLRLYPPEFRRRYGAAMTETFRVCYQATKQTRLKFWLFIVADTGCAVAMQYVDVGHAALRRPITRWVLACVLGAMCCELAGSALTWSFGYFYHPYLEGLRFAPWVYGSLLGAGLGAMQRLVLRGMSPVAWILVSAASAAIGLEFAIVLAPTIGPVGYGIVVGAMVAGGQWFMLRGHIQGAAWFVATSAIVLAAVSISGIAAMNQVLAGLNPLPGTIGTGPPTDGLALLMRGLSDPMNGTEWAFAVATMAITGAVVAAMTANHVSSRLSRTP
jgi:hypothetical protein